MEIYDNLMDEFDESKDKAEGAGKTGKDIYDYVGGLSESDSTACTAAKAAADKVRASASRRSTPVLAADIFENPLDFDAITMRSRYRMRNRPSVVCRNGFALGRLRRAYRCDTQAP